MSIKKLIIQTVCDTCEDKIIGKCDHLDNKDICIYCDRKANMAIKQIISEIVQELEKIQNIYSGDIHAINLCIKTIKKMGEV